MISMDAVLDSFKMIVLLVLVIYVLIFAKKNQLVDTPGWKYIQIGFAFILFGAFLDITDNFESLNSYIIIRDIRVEAVLETIAGYITGLVFLIIGALKWTLGVKRQMEQEFVRQKNQGSSQEHSNSLEENFEKQTSELKKEIAERDRIEDALYFIAQGGWQSDGPDFLKSLVGYLGRKLDMDYVFVDELMEDKVTAKTVALYSMGEFPENIAYPLRGTPCANVIGKTLCCYSSQVQQSFPDDEMLVDMDAESYVGIPLWSSKNEPIGLIAVMARKPIESSQAIEIILQIVAVRAAHEIEKRQEEVQRASLEKRLRHVQKMKAVGQLTGGIAHDFNNILGIVSGNLEIIQSLAPDNKKIVERAEKALNGIKRGTNITRKLQSFSNTDTHKTQVLSVNEYAKNLGGLIKKSITASIIVNYKLSNDLWSILVDPGDLQDAILNLSINARDAMPNGGTLSIETTNKTLDEIYVQQYPGTKAGDYVQITISDTGIGISEDNREKVLEPFFTTKDQTDGSGLGLSMVYGFVQRSGGYLDIQSQVGEGTSIYLYLPRTAEAVLPENKTTKDSSVFPVGTETILIVDDEYALLDVAVIFLETLGYTAITARSGEEALQIIRKTPSLDLLFSDVVMPGEMNGYELAKACRSERPELKIILTSGFTNKHEENLEGANSYMDLLTLNLLAKPYSMLDLAVAVRNILDSE
jgi:signal transduction histidine kinase/ActR/RegA family two-component response regulator